jgi:nucleotide-binding universal stress UspA family protein
MVFMYPGTLAERVRAYLDLQAFLDECRADGLDCERACRAVEQTRREILDALDGAPSTPIRPLAKAIRAYFEAEHAFDKAGAAGLDLDGPARRMERARRDLERQLAAPDAQPTGATAPKPAAMPAPGHPPHRRRILVPYDESTAARYALEVAVQTARESSGTVMLVHVVQPATGAGGEYVCSLERLDIMHHHEAEEMLARVAKEIPAPLQVERVVREGAAADEILAAASAWNADLIVMGTRARGRLAQFLLGGTAEAVIRRAACPVVTVGRRAAWAAPVETLSAALTERSAHAVADST